MFRRFRLRSRLFVFLTGVLLPIALFWGCTSSAPVSQTSSPAGQTASSSASQTAGSPEDLAKATEIAKGIIAACPVADPGDDTARNTCADNLTKFELLRDSIDETIVWGGQKEANLVTLKDNNTTSFDPLVWRRTYLSTFMFSGEPKVEQKDNLTIARLPIQFRNQLDEGAFPYPFWHSKRKWDSYQQANELLLVMEDGMLKGALRSFEKDPTRSNVKMEWDGHWDWTDASGEQQPKVVLYKYLFSETNPHVKALDTAYRAFEVEMRQHSCTVCHNPSNANETNPLLILSYPNQALTLRNETLRQIENDLMPPPKGIADPAEKQKMIELAKVFAEAGDKALAYEGEKPTTTASTSSLSQRS